MAQAATGVKNDSSSQIVVFYRYHPCDTIDRSDGLLAGPRITNVLNDRQFNLIRSEPNNSKAAQHLLNYINRLKYNKKKAFLPILLAFLDNQISYVRNGRRSSDASDDEENRLLVDIGKINRIIVKSYKSTQNMDLFIGLLDQSLGIIIASLQNKKKTDLFESNHDIYSASMTYRIGGSVLFNPIFPSCFVKTKLYVEPVDVAEIKSVMSPKYKLLHEYLRKMEEALLAALTLQSMVFSLEREIDRCLKYQDYIILKDKSEKTVINNIIVKEGGCDSLYHSRMHCPHCCRQKQTVTCHM